MPNNNCQPGIIAFIAIFAVLHIKVNRTIGGLQDAFQMPPLSKHNCYVQFIDPLRLCYRNSFSVDKLCNEPLIPCGTRKCYLAVETEFDFQFCES